MHVCDGNTPRLCECVCNRDRASACTIEPRSLPRTVQLVCALTPHAAHLAALGDGDGGKGLLARREGAATEQHARAGRQGNSRGPSGRLPCGPRAAVLPLAQAWPQVRARLVRLGGAGLGQRAGALAGRHPRLRVGGWVDGEVAGCCCRPALLLARAQAVLLAAVHAPACVCARAYVPGIWACRGCPLAVVVAARGAAAAGAACSGRAARVGQRVRAAASQ